jgi:hypothetical protein
LEVWDTVEDVDESFDRMTALGKLHFYFVQSQVWRVDGNVKSDVPLVDVGKFYDNSCYIVLYTYQGDKSDRKEEYLLCYWLGQQASLEDKAAAATLTSEIYLSLKDRPVQARIFQGKEPPQFLALFQCMCILKVRKLSGQPLRYKVYLY